MFGLRFVCFRRENTPSGVAWLALWLVHCPGPSHEVALGWIQSGEYHGRLPAGGFQPLGETENTSWRTTTHGDSDGFREMERQVQRDVHSVAMVFFLCFLHDNDHTEMLWRASMLHMLDSVSGPKLGLIDGLSRGGLTGQSCK